MPTRRNKPSKREKPSLHKKLRGGEMTIAEANARIIKMQKEFDDKANKLLCSVIKMKTVPLQKVNNFPHLMRIYQVTIEDLKKNAKKFKNEERQLLANFIKEKRLANLRQALVMTVEENDPTILRLSLYIIHDTKKNQNGISTNKTSRRKT